MAQLQVNNRILNYKGISYQIAQINSLKIVEIKRKKEEPKENDEIIKPVAITAVVTFFFTFALLQDLNPWGLLTGIVCGISVYVLVPILKAKWEYETGPKFDLLYGLSLRMSNRDDPLFVSNDKNVLLKVQNAIFAAMNGENENLSVKFDNVTIEIMNSENIEIGNILGGEL